MYSDEKTEIHSMKHLWNWIDRLEKEVNDLTAERDKLKKKVVKLQGKVDAQKREIKLLEKVVAKQ